MQNGYTIESYWASILVKVKRLFSPLTDSHGCSDNMERIPTEIPLCLFTEAVENYWFYSH